MVFLLANKLSYSAKDISSLGYEMAETLRSMSKGQEAAIILIEYCKDVEEAATSLIEGNEWKEAMRLVHYSIIDSPMIYPTLSHIIIIFLILLSIGLRP